jgi:hypothetical protein
MLHIGEKVGTKSGPEFDIAVDPLEGTNFTAKGLPNAFSVLAVAESGNLLSAPDTYMEKIIIGSNLPKNLLDLDNSVEENINLLAAAKNKKSNEPNLINYRGNYTIENSLSITDTTGLEKLKNKVVLIGLYENDTDGKPIYTEDTHWAPTNENYFGRSEKNIYGIEIQAHIISSIINNDFISSKSTFNNLFQFAEYKYIILFLKFAF